MIALRERLQEWDEERLGALAGYWGVAARGADGAVDVDALVERMASSTSIRTAFEQLAPPERDILRAMDAAAHKGWVVIADIRRLAGLPEGTVAGLLESLEARAIAFAEERELPVENPYWSPDYAGRRLETRPTPVLAFPQETNPLLLDLVGEYVGGTWYAEVPSPLNRLEMLPLRTLLAMADHYGVSPDGTADSAGKLAVRLHPILKDHAAIWQVACALPPELRGVLAAAEAAGGRLPMEEVRRCFAPEYPDLHHLVGALTERGLGFDRFVHRTRMLLVPDRVLEALARHTLPDLPPAPLEPAAAPATQECWNHDLHWSLLILVRHVRLEGLARTATAFAIPKRVAARLVAQMGRAPTDRPAEEWVEQMVRYLGAMEVLASTAHVALNGPQVGWVRQDVSSQARALLDRWRRGRIEDLRQNRYDLRLWMDESLLAAGRGLLVDQLGRCEPGSWYTVASLLRSAAGQCPHFLRERDRLVHQHGYRGLKQMLRSWFDVEGRALLMHLTGLPLELGMVAFDRVMPAGGVLPPDALFSLTEWGAALLGPAPQTEAPANGKVLVVQPNFEVLAMEMAPAVLDTLGQFAAPAGYDRVAAYRVDHGTVNLAVANGWTGERILGFLEEHGRNPLPQNVAQSIRDWAGSVRRARYVRALVIESDDPAALEEMASSRLLRRHVRGISRGAVLLVDLETDLEQLSRDLRAEGFILEPGA